MPAYAPTPTHHSFNPCGTLRNAGAKRGAARESPHPNSRPKKPLRVHALRALNGAPRLHWGHAPAPMGLAKPAPMPNPCPVIGDVKSSAPLPAFTGPSKRLHPLQKSTIVCTYPQRDVSCMSEAPGSAPVSVPPTSARQALNYPQTQRSTLGGPFHAGTDTQRARTFGISRKRTVELESVPRMQIVAPLEWLRVSNDGAWGSEMSLYSLPLHGHHARPDTPPRPCCGPNSGRRTNGGRSCA